MKYAYLTFIILFVFPATTSFGQKEGWRTDDGPVGIFNSGAEYDQFMGSAKRAAYGEGGNQALRDMIPILNDMALAQPFGTTANRYQGTTASSLGLLSDARVREEIGMVDEQYEELQKLNRDIQERAAEQIRSLDFDDREGLVERIREIREQMSEDAESLFLPEQLERLEQLRNQTRLRGRSLVQILTLDPIKSDLELSETQVEKLRDEEEKIRKEIEEEIARLREKARDRILDQLDSEQREKVENMFGDSFQFSAAPENEKKNYPRNSKGKSSGKWSK